MPAKSRFTRLDAFTKTVEDARIRTTSGGVVTIVSLIVVFFLAWGEWADYRRIVIHPELIVDKGRGKPNPRFSLVHGVARITKKQPPADPCYRLQASAWRSI